MNTRICNLAAYITGEVCTRDLPAIKLLTEAVATYPIEEITDLLCHEWIISLTNEDKLSILEDAREEFIRDEDIKGMCRALYRVIQRKHSIRMWEVSPMNIFPEFNPATLGGCDITGGFWWRENDRESRVKAFDKLISIYREKQDIEADKALYELINLLRQ